jgi:hypothetical protein
MSEILWDVQFSQGTQDSPSVRVQDHALPIKGHAKKLFKRERQNTNAHVPWHYNGENVTYKYYSPTSRSPQRIGSLSLSLSLRQ